VAPSSSSRERARTTELGSQPSGIVSTTAPVSRATMVDSGPASRTTSKDTSPPETGVVGSRQATEDSRWPSTAATGVDDRAPLAQVTPAAATRADVRRRIRECI